MRDGMEIESDVHMILTGMKANNFAHTGRLATV